jgi:transcriptional regulator with XRE-family HTH domain
MKKSVWQKSYTNLAMALKEMRLKADLTQKMLADKLEKPQSYVSKYENGDRYLDFIEVIAVCKACNCAPTQLIEDLNLED